MCNLEDGIQLIVPINRIVMISYRKIWFGSEWFFGRVEFKNGYIIVYICMKNMWENNEHNLHLVHVSFYFLLSFTLISCLSVQTLPEKKKKIRLHEYQREKFYFKISYLT